MENAKSTPCPAVYMWDSSGLNVAIPKRNGIGYLRVPLGHRHVRPLAFIEIDEMIDIYGLDGYLALTYGYTDFSEREAIVNRVMPMLAKHFRFSEWKEDVEGFWKIVESGI